LVRTSRRVVRHARRWSIWRRRSCIFSDCRLAATWTGLRELICSYLLLPVINR